MIAQPNKVSTLLRLCRVVYYKTQKSLLTRRPYHIFINQNECEAKGMSDEPKFAAGVGISSSFGVSFHHLPECWLVVAVCFRETFISLNDVCFQLVRYEH